MAPERKIRWFFKHILSFNIELGKLRLPMKFIRSLNKQIPDTVKLHTPDKRVWTMKVVEEESHFWLKDGFGRFARHYSLKEGQQVHFQHKSKSTFSVRIFDKSCCEIAYPDSLPNPTTKKPETSQKKPELPKFMSETGLASPRHFKSKRPFFQVELKSYNKEFRVVYVPESFRKKYMGKTQVEEMKLKVKDAREWKVSLKRKLTGRLNFGKGWKAFYGENQLKEGDVCIFELAKGTSSVFNAYIFVAV